MPKSKRNAPAPGFLEGPQRLNKVLAAAGLGSRRQVEELIEQGRVEIDGKVVSDFSSKVDPSVARISVDGQSLKKQKAVYFAVNKPAGVLCTNRDPEGRPRVIDLVPAVARLFPVGRLDRSSLGLILLTNDGELAQRLAHPRFSVAKSYFVVVQGQIGYEELARLRRGIYLAEGVARVEGAKIRRVRKGCTELDITLTEGKNREIRRVLARLGHKVVVLRRVAIGPLRLADLPEGSYRPLHSTEIAALYHAAEQARLAKKGKLAPEGEEGESEEPAKKSAKGSSDSKNKKKDRGNSSLQEVDSKKGKRPTNARSKAPSLDDDELLIDRYDDEEGAYEDDELVPSMETDDPDDWSSSDESYDEEPELDPKKFIEVSPTWNNDEFPVSNVLGGVIDYEEEFVEEEGTDEEKEARREANLENNKILKRRPKGSRQAERRQADRPEGRGVKGRGKRGPGTQGSGTKGAGTKGRFGKASKGASRGSRSGSTQEGRPSGSRRDDAMPIGADGMTSKRSPRPRSSDGERSESRPERSGFMGRRADSDSSERAQSRTSGSRPGKRSVKRTGSKPFSKGATRKEGSSEPRSDFSSERPKKSSFKSGPGRKFGGSDRSGGRPSKGKKGGGGGSSGGFRGSSKKGGPGGKRRRDR